MTAIDLEQAKRFARGVVAPAFVASAQGRVFGVNRAFVELAGPSSAAHAETDWQRLLDPRDADTAASAWTDFTRGAAVKEVRARLLQPGGESSRWVRLQFSRVLFDEEGEDFFVLGKCHDLHDLVEIAHELEERAQLLEMSDAQMQVGHWHIFGETGQLRWSDEVHRIHGTDPATYRPILEQGVDAYHPDDRQMVGSVVGAALEQSHPFEFRARIVRPSGDLRHVRVAGRPIGTNGTDIAGVIQDVTELVELDARLVLSEERYALAVDASQDGLWDWNVASGELWWSGRFKQIVGLSSDAPIPGIEFFSERLHPAEADATMAAVNDHLERRRPFDVEYRMRHESGREVWIRAKGQARWDEAGRPVRMVGTVSDITAEREARGQLALKTLELEARNVELDRFASIASHDMREPLRKIRSFTDRIIARESIEDDKTLDYLKRIRGSAARLHEMVGDLLAITKVPSQARHREPVDVGSVTRRVLEVLSPILADVDVEVDVDDLPEIVANPVQIQQLFQNLLENAIKYRHQVRPLRIWVRGARLDNGWASFEVEDNGIGFDPAYAERIFLLFERLHGRSEYPGTGLGLALCQRVVAEYGGTIEAVGCEGFGSTFTVKLPVSASEEIAA